ncbi:MAG: C25 family cysteine peptidase [Candidatus Zixiibacteriota bacterium]
MKHVILLFGLIVMFGLSLLVTPCALATGEQQRITVTIPVGGYEIIDTESGHQIVVEGFGYLMEPGKPMLPAKSFLVALPPGASVQSVDVKGINAHHLPGTYRILPSPPLLPLVDPYLHRERIEELQREWEINKKTVYSSNQAYPNVRGKLKSSGTLRKYSYASVSFYPFSYSPQSGRLVYYGAARITIDYDLPSPGSIEAQRVEELRWDTVADDRAARLFINYEQIKGSYQPIDSRSEDRQDIYDYVILTDGGLLSAINSSDFPNWKATLGCNIRIVLTTDAEITGQPGGDLAEQIRNFLMGCYGSWGTEYVLLVGDYATIPMRYCYPDSNNHLNGAGDPSAWPWAGDVPTDYYYADLSGPDSISWDSDGDGFYGEYGQDSPDFLAEVYVGRIPANNTTRITYTLNKLVAFEQDTGDWKNRALHAGAIAYYANENHSGRELLDGAALINEIETDIMNGWAISHYSEQGGLAPSAYPWSALSETAFIGDWRNGQYGIVNWYAHGWSSYVARRVWSWDDGDRVPETYNPNEMWHPGFIGIYSNLDDDFPSIVFALSCVVGYPEPNAWGNLGIDLLTKPSFGASAGIVSGTRVVWVSTGGGEEHCYEFNHYLVDGPGGPEKVGEALYNSEFYCSQAYNWEHYAEYWDLFTFNLYGDPALERRGESTIGLAGNYDLPAKLPKSFFLSQNYPNPLNAFTIIRYGLPLISEVTIEIYNLLGRKVEKLAQGEQQAGYHQIVWDAKDNSSGLYFYRIHAGDFAEAKKMLLLK